MSKRKAPARKAAAPSFEKALERLEAIAARLEDEELSLDESLELFEEGMTLSRQCGKRLEVAESKIEALVRRDDGRLQVTPLDGDESSS